MDHTSGHQKPDRLPSYIGERIRRRRGELNLTLRELSRRTGLTPGFLSKVETNKCSISLTSLLMIGGALDVPMFYFLREEERSSPIVRTGQRRQIRFPDSHIRYELLTPDTARELMGALIRMEPGTSFQAVALARPTHEWMLVLQGRLEILIGETTSLLEAGDCISYEGRQLRRFASVGQEDLLIVCSVTPPAL